MKTPQIIPKIITGLGITIVLLVKMQGMESEVDYHFAWVGWIMIFIAQVNPAHWIAGLAGVMLAGLGTAFVLFAYSIGLHSGETCNIALIGWGFAFAGCLVLILQSKVFASKPIRVTCPHCKAVLEPEGSLGDDKAPCPACGREFVPDPNEINQYKISKGPFSKKALAIDGVILGFVGVSIWLLSIKEDIQCDGQSFKRENPELPLWLERAMEPLDETSLDDVAIKAAAEIRVSEGVMGWHGSIIRAWKIKGDIADVLVETEIKIYSGEEWRNISSSLTLKERQFRMWMDGNCLFIHLEKSGEIWQATSWRWLGIDDWEAWWRVAEENARNKFEISIEAGLRQTGWEVWIRNKE